MQRYDLEGQVPTALPQPRYAVIMQKKLSLSLIEGLPEAILRPLAELCACIASELPPPDDPRDDALLLSELMNLLMNRGYLEDMIRLRSVCRTTSRSAFPVPVPNLSHVELPTGVIESFVAGDRSSLVSTAYAHSALVIHRSIGV